MEDYSVAVETQMARFFRSLNERDRRRYAAVEAVKLGTAGSSMCRGCWDAIPGRYVAGSMSWGLKSCPSMTASEKKLTVTDRGGSVCTGLHRRMRRPAGSAASSRGSGAGSSARPGFTSPCCFVSEGATGQNSLTATHFGDDIWILPTVEQKRPCFTSSQARR
jgi:hypothetical protein